MKTNIMSVCPAFTATGFSRFCKHCGFTELMHRIHKKVPSTKLRIVENKER